MKNITSINLIENDKILIVCNDDTKYTGYVDLWYSPISEIRPRFFREMNYILQGEGYNYVEAFIMFINAAIEKLTGYTKEQVFEYYF